MNEIKQHDQNWTEEDLLFSDYYRALTGLALYHPSGLLPFHYGLWGPDTTCDKEALLRANQTLVRGCDINREWRMLDAGCGVGGTAIWLAQEFGCKVTGLTNCKPHAELATELAQQRGVGDLVEFVHGDFMEMPFPDACFDAVTNHESYCYAPDKPAYLHGVYRILKPGGRWQAMDGFLTDKTLSESEEAIHTDMQRGWLMAPLRRRRDVLADLEEAGFKDIGEQDLDAEIAPALEKLINLWNLLGAHFIPPDQKWAYERFKEGITSSYAGLLEGAFTYRLIYGVKP